MPREEVYSPLPPWPRTDYCGVIRACDQGREVALWGWVDARRDHGSLIFVDLRDRTGIIQLVFNPERNAAAHEVAKSVRSEFYLAVKGAIIRRGDSTVNAELPTGEIEVMVSQIEIMNVSQPPPFAVSDGAGTAEEVRLKYRYLDLRRPEMQRNLRRRHQALRAVRDYLDAHDFVEIETPILFKATPEGARDYLVPSRISPGKFYALPQSPQLLKQTLMVGGFDRYYQIARCFRDEDLRANRQPEFTQIDIEMTGARPADIIALTEGMYAAAFDRVLGVKLELPFVQMPYEEAMERFGSDKPDTRFDLELKNLSGAFSGTSFKIFSEVLSRGESIYGIRVPADWQLTRRELDETAESMRTRQGMGLAWVKSGQAEWQGPIGKHVEEPIRSKVEAATDLSPGDTLLLMAGRRDQVRPLLGDLRLSLGEKFGLARPNDLNFVWVLDFPLFEYSEQDKRWYSKHHPFTAPRPEDLLTLEKEPLAARALAYDVVLNGQEMGGGSIRIHNRELQLKVLEILGFSREEAMERFGFLLDALTFGAPPHGGIACGVDRLAMMLCGTDSLRDVTAFPKTQKAVDPMSGAPSEVPASQLRELSIKIVT